MDIKAPTEFCNPSITVVEDRHYKDSSHEVYFVYKEGTFELLYIGCGKKGRHKHVFSGISQNIMLNVCFVFSVDLKIYVFGCESKEEALERESKGIEELKPEFNYVARDQIASFKVEGKLAIKGLGSSFKPKEVGLEAICELYDTNRQECMAKYPGWSQIISRVGTSVCKSLSYNKARVRAYDQGLSLQQSAETQRTVKNTFQVGQIYLASDIKKTFDKLGFEKPKGTTLSRWFHIKKTTKNGSVAYKILAPLDCFELN